MMIGYDRLIDGVYKRRKAQAKAKVHDREFEHLLISVIQTTLRKIPRDIKTACGTTQTQCPKPPKQESPIKQETQRTMTVLI